MQLITYKEWRKTNNPFLSFNGKPFSNIDNAVLNEIYNLIDNHFNERYIGSDVDTFSRFFTETLTIYEFSFFSSFQYTYNANKNLFDDLLYNKENSQSDGLNTNESRNATTSDSRSDTSTSSRNDITASDNSLTKGRSLLSDTPNSNISSDISTNVDIDISWKYATNLGDTYTKNTSNSDSTSNGSQNSNSNSQDTSNTDYTSTTKNHYEKEVKKIDVDNLGKMLDIFKRESAYIELIKKLEKLFLYKMKGIELW